MKMERHLTTQFFSAFVEAVQKLCQDSVAFDHSVEVSGYVCLEIDSSKKERYVISELVQSTGSIISESFCSKVFRTMKTPLATKCVQTESLNPQEEHPAMLDTSVVLPDCRFNRNSQHGSSSHPPSSPYWLQPNHLNTSLLSSPQYSHSIQRPQNTHSSGGKSRVRKGTPIRRVTPNGNFINSECNPYYRASKLIDCYNGFPDKSGNCSPIANRETNLQVNSPSPSSTITPPINTNVHVPSFESPQKRSSSNFQSPRGSPENQYDKGDSSGAVNLILVKQEKQDPMDCSEKNEEKPFVKDENKTVKEDGTTELKGESSHPVHQKSGEDDGHLDLLTTFKTNPTSEEEEQNIEFVYESEDSSEDIVNQADFEKFFKERNTTCPSDGNENYMESENKNTIRKTVAHVKLFQNYLKSNGEERQFHAIPAIELDKLLGNFLVGIKKDNGEDYEPTYLRNIQSSLERYLRSMGYTYSITKHHAFQNSRYLLKCKQDMLVQQGKGNPNRTAPITANDVNILYAKGQLGYESADALLNTLWFSNTVHFGIKSTKDHHSLKWGDIIYGQLEDGNDFIEYIGNSSKYRGTSAPLRVYAQTDNRARCPVMHYKIYATNRPEDFCRPDDPFYLAVNYFRTPKDAWYKRQQIGLNRMGSMLRRMTQGAGFPQEKRLTNLSAHKHGMTQNSTPNDDDLPCA
ncbi:hypothetical protein ScPMuIL_000270 [Solemya velum]